MNTMPPQQAAEQRAVELGHDLLAELLRTANQAQAVESVAHHLTIAFAETDGPVWATVGGLAVTLAPVLQAGLEALRKEATE